MDKFQSKIKFDNYWVEKMELFADGEQGGLIVGSPSEHERLRLGVSYTPTDKGMLVTVRCDLLVECPGSSEPSFGLKLVVTGSFSITQHGNGIDKESREIDALLKANTVAILYPYVRNIVSSACLIANRPPVILPTINTFKLIEEQEMN